MAYPSLAGQVAVVTGGAKWIGREICRRLLDDGCVVIVADIDEEAGSEAIADLGGAERTTRFVPTDVTDADSVGTLAEAVRSAFGGLDILVNNASTLATLERKPFWELTRSEWQRSIDINLTGMWQTMALMAPVMMDRPTGSIINMTSGVVYVGRPGHAHYVASKAGVVGLTRSAARELGPHGIRVNAIAPSFVETQRTELSAERRAALTAEMALDDVPQPEDVAAAAAFLASEEARHITGQVLSVDSGLTHH